MEDLGRPSMSIDGRETLDIMADGHRNHDQELTRLQSELYQAQQAIASLADVGSGDSTQKLLQLAAENTKLKNERDNLLKWKEESEEVHCHAMQELGLEISDLKHKLMHSEAERDRFLRKCQELEQRLADEESRFYQLELDDSLINARVQQRLQQETQNTQVNDIFNQIDQTDDLCSFISQTQTAAANLEQHSVKMNNYQSNIGSLYEQLKQTAKFLADIVHNIGLDNPQVELLFQKINRLQLDVKESHEMSIQLVNESKQIATELTQASMRMEESLRQSMVEPSQSSFAVETSQHNTKAFEELAAKNAELLEKDEKLANEIKELNRQLTDLKSKHGNSVKKVAELKKIKSDTIHKLEVTLKLVEERDEELKVRAEVIEQLRAIAEKNNGPKVPDNLEQDIENQLRHIYTTLTGVNNKLQKKTARP